MNYTSGSKIMLAGGNRSFTFPSFRDGNQVWAPIIIMMTILVTGATICGKYAAWLRNDTKETRLGLAAGHWLLVWGEIIYLIVYLVAALVIFQDIMVYLGMIIGSLIGAAFQYYLVTVCLRFGAMKALEEAAQA